MGLYVTAKEPMTSPDEDEPAKTRPEKMQQITVNCLPKWHTPHFEECLGNGETLWLLKGATRKVVKHGYDFEYGKLSAENVICEALQTVRSQQRVLIAACGPPSLMASVRDSADRYRREAGYIIDVHSEDFGS